MKPLLHIAFVALLAAPAVAQQPPEIPLDAPAPDAVDPFEHIAEDFESAVYETGGFDLRSVSGAVWSTGGDAARLELQLHGWAQRVDEDFYCENAGFAGCSDVAGGWVGFEAVFDIARNLELRLRLGTSASNHSIAADAGASIIWWFSRHVGLALGVGYLHALPVGGDESAVPAMYEFDRAFTHETPYDMPGGRGAAGTWFGGFGLITRD